MAEPTTMAMIGSAAIGGAASYMGGAKANAANEKMFNKQLKWERYKLHHGPAAHAKALERAGLNRILAAGGQPTPTGSPTPTQMRNVEGEAVAEAMNALQLQKVKSEIKLNNKLGNKAQNEADVVGAKVPLMKTVGKVSKQALDTLITPAKQTAKRIKKQYREVEKNVKPEHKHYFQSPQYFKFGR